MPRPVFVILAHGVSEDKTTNLVSLFTIVEVVRHPVAAEEKPTDPSSDKTTFRLSLFSELTALAVWMREDGDEQTVFEHQFAVYVPGETDEKLTVPPQPFQFEAEKSLRRFRLNIQGLLPVGKESGIMELESRVRKAESSDEWLRQRYPIVSQILIGKDADAHLDRIVIEPRQTGDM